jgi:hypothetical protein
MQLVVAKQAAWQAARFDEALYTPPPTLVLAFDVHVLVHPPGATLDATGTGVVEACIPELLHVYI